MSAASAFAAPPSLIANTKLVGAAGWAWANAVAQAARAGASTSSSRRARLRRRAKLILSPFMGGKPARTQTNTAHCSGFPPVQPGCLGVVALGPWLCVPDFRPVCPCTFETVAKTAHQHTDGSNANYHKQLFTPDS